MIEALGRANLDFVWVDLQHQGFSPYDSYWLGNLVRAAESTGTTLLVRVPVLDRSIIGKVLDSGVQNVLIPELKTQDEISQAASSARFRFAGKPGMRSAPLARATDWRYPSDEIMKKMDETTMVGVMVEQKEMVDGLGDTITLSEVDFAYLGLNDLALSLDLPVGKSRTLDEYVSKVVKYCNGKGLPLGRTALDTETAKSALKAGFRFLNLGTDVVVIRSHFEKLMDEFKSFR